VLLLLQQIERVSGKGNGNNDVEDMDENEMSICIVSLYYLCKMIRILASESYKVKRKIYSCIGFDPRLYSDSRGIEIRYMWSMEFSYQFIDRHVPHCTA
jgi:hypothetical protein